MTFYCLSCGWEGDQEDVAIHSTPDREYFWQCPKCLSPVEVWEDNDKVDGEEE